MAEKINQVDARLKVEFQLVEQRMHEHSARMEAMMLNLKTSMRRQAKLA